MVSCGRQTVTVGGAAGPGFQMGLDPVGSCKEAQSALRDEVAMMHRERPSLEYRHVP